MLLYAVVFSLPVSAYSHSTRGRGALSDLANLIVQPVKNPVVAGLNVWEQAGAPFPSRVCIAHIILRSTE